MSKRRLLITAAIAIPIVALVALSTLSGRVDPYPTTPAGWNARLDAHLAEFGATRGENWDLWLDVSAELDRMTDDPAAVTDEQLAATLDRLAGLERITPPFSTYPDPDPSNEPFQSATIVRSAYRDLIAPRLRRSIEQNDGVEAARWIDRASRLCLPLEDAAVIGALVQIALIETLIDDVLTTVSVTPPTDAAALAALQDAINNFDSADPARAFASEREWGLPYIAESARDGWPTQTRTQIRDYDRLLTDAASIHEDPAALGRIQAYGDKLANRPMFAKRRLALDLIFPAVDKAWPLFKTAPPARDGTTLLIAVARHRAAHGQYPATLDDLDPTILSPLPEDPFAPDKRFVYRVLDATAERPIVAILLYTIGADARDDGGLHDPKNKPLIPGGTGDFAFTRPPEPESPPADGDSEDAASEPEDQP